MVRYLVKVNGIVQGVGFRPFVFRMAEELSLYGFVRNTSGGVAIEIEGSRENCESFVSSLTSNSPPLATIEEITTCEIPLCNSTEFVILSSKEGTCSTWISPDIGICDACAADIKTKGGLRYRYAFTNCTNCGPRFTILRDVPYDRKNTTMAEFTLCPHCQQEYENPYDRRFHAQPNACPVCGPQLSFYRNGIMDTRDIYKLFKESMDCGQIVALKGIGGYHLVCDAAKEETVKLLRFRKHRYDKPFAVMMRDIETVEKYCELNAMEKAALTSSRKPIVLLKKRVGFFDSFKSTTYQISESTTMSNKRIGVMLPYTPLHCILMQEQEVLVMTSGNVSERPMIFEEKEALLSLSQVADAVLTHNRPIYRRMDDSVCMVVNNKLCMIRRARGYVPEPFPLPGNTNVILALGAQQKNTFCLAKGKDAFLSGHIGDLEEEDTCQCFEKEIEDFIRIFEAVPKVIACDMHPDYVSTRYASCLQAKYESDTRKPIILTVQHHHAHFASVLAEHMVEEERVLGFIFDGTGYGEDGCIWGGEVLYGNIGQSKRIGHLLYFPLLGGEMAIKEPWRAALAAVNMSLGRTEALNLFPDRMDAAKMLLRAGDKSVNAPFTSSMGRLFDSVAALAGVQMQTTYEGQAAVELQQVMDEYAEGQYQFALSMDEGMLIFDWRPLIREIRRDIKAGVSPGTISLRFHRGVVALIIEVAMILGKQTNSRIIVLSGGVFQNDYLLGQAISGLEEKGFLVYCNERVPINDGGISFGQAAAASVRVR